MQEIAKFRVFVVQHCRSRAISHGVHCAEANQRMASSSQTAQVRELAAMGLHLEAMRTGRVLGHSRAGTRGGGLRSCSTQSPADIPSDHVLCVIVGSSKPLDGSRVHLFLKS